MAGNDHYDAEPAKKRTRRFAIGLVLSVLVVAALVFLAYRTLGAGGDDQVTVPDVAGQTVTEAMKTLSRAGLVPRSVGQPSATVAQNHVIRTDPPDGDKVDKGADIVVYFASEKPQSMPRVIGMTLSDAQDALLNDGVDPSRITVHRERNDTCDPGKVIRSDPVPTSELGSTTQVTLWVCAGPESEVPAIGPGTDVSTAEKILRDTGYDTTQTSQFSSDVPSGKVIGTNPSAGTRLAAGETVTIIVSSGPAPTTPPSTSPPTEAPTTAPPTEAPTTVPTPTAPSPTEAGSP